MIWQSISTIAANKSYSPELLCGGFLFNSHISHFDWNFHLGIFNIYICGQFFMYEMDFVPCWKTTGIQICLPIVETNNIYDYFIRMHNILTEKNAVTIFSGKWEFLENVRLFHWSFIRKLLFTYPFQCILRSDCKQFTGVQTSVKRGITNHTDITAVDETAFLMLTLTSNVSLNHCT